MRIISIKLLALVCLVLIMGSCSRLSNNEIKKSWWLYGSGHNIGDALRFENDDLKGDTIYSNDKPIAIILSCGKGMFRKTAILEIKDIKTGEEGTYHDKGPR
jgi:hypothetical protein